MRVMVPAVCVHGVVLVAHVALDAGDAVVDQAVEVFDVDGAVDTCYVNRMLVDLIGGLEVCDHVRVMAHGVGGVREGFHRGGHARAHGIDLKLHAPEGGDGEGGGLPVAPAAGAEQGLGLLAGQAADVEVAHIDVADVLFAFGYVIAEKQPAHGDDHRESEHIDQKGRKFSHRFLLPGRRGTRSARRRVRVLLSILHII